MVESAPGVETIENDLDPEEEEVTPPEGFYDADEAVETSEEEEP